MPRRAPRHVGQGDRLPDALEQVRRARLEHLGDGVLEGRRRRGRTIRCLRLNLANGRLDELGGGVAERFFDQGGCDDAHFHRV